MKKRNLWGGLATIIVGGAVIAGAAFAGPQLRAVIPHPATTSAVVVAHEESRALVNAPVHPVAAIPVAVAPPIAVQEVAPSGPVLCPEGTTANSVDDAGNESNCQTNGPGNQPCVRYDDNNVCVAWYQP